MRVSYHAEDALVALTQRMPVPASVIIARLRAEPAPDHSIALEVCRLQYAVGEPHIGSNGDSVVVIIRNGRVKTAMLRRSYNQSFDPAVLRVDEFRTWKDEWHAHVA